MQNVIKNISDKNLDPFTLLDQILWLDRTRTMFHLHIAHCFSHYVPTQVDVCWVIKNIKITFAKQTLRGQFDHYHEEKTTNLAINL